MSEQRIGVMGVATIIDALRTNPHGCTLTSLELHYLTLKTKVKYDMKAQLASNFVTFLQPCYTRTRLKEVSFHDNYLGDDFVCIFVNGLKYNPQLETLNLCCNDITNKGVVELGNVLYYNSTLKGLDVSGNQISDEGMISITHSIRYHPTLEELFLLSSYPSDKGLT
jgi:Ran GTPase-activating protein (RanGAP) involved in mRNA processing and transport